MRQGALSLRTAGWDVPMGQVASGRSRPAPLQESWQGLKGSGSWTWEKGSQDVAYSLSDEL